MFSRRSFLTRSGIAAATATVTGAPYIARSAEELATKTGQKPKRIIHIVSDGMSQGMLTLADLFAQSQLQRGLSWVKLYSNPAVRMGLMNTRSLNSLVTDSAAASSSWGSGSRVTNGALNVLPDGRLLTPLYSLFAQQGWARGLVTTAEITHATPAGFAAATRSRDNAQIIAAQYLDHQIDVLLGGGKPFFKPDRRKDKRDLRAEFTAAGYSVVGNRADLEKAPTDTRLLGLFADSHLPFTVDLLDDAKQRAEVPTLAEMTRAALVRLEQKDRFILQVEGARVDHAAHNSDAAAGIREQIALDEAIDICLEFQQRNPDTLIVLTTDHGNSNPGLNGMGPTYRHSPQRFAALNEVKASFPRIIGRLKRRAFSIRVPPIGTDAEDKLDIPEPMAKVIPAGEAATAEEGEEKGRETRERLVPVYEVFPKDIIPIVAEMTGYKMSTRRAQLLAEVLAGDYRALYDDMNAETSQLGQLMANRIGVGWTGNTHTSDYVQVLALGPGSERFVGMIQNHDIFTHYTQLAGIDFRNESMPLIADFDGRDVERAHRYAFA